MSVAGLEAVVALAAGLVVGGTVGFVLGRRRSRPAAVAPPAEGPAAALPAPVPVVPAVLEGPEATAFDAAVEGAAAEGWSPRLPDAVDLARGFEEGDDGARAFVLALEQAARRGLSTLDDAFARQLAVDRVWDAAAALAATHGLELLVRSPRAVGPRDHERWLVDEELARRWQRLGPSGVVQPVLVLRPAVIRDGRVLLEGLVV